MRGHPSQKHHKHKWKHVNEESKEADVRVCLETGCNRLNEIITGSDQMTVARENHMKAAEKEQY